MSKTPASVDPVAERLLDGVAGLIAATPYCWLATQGESAGVSARPMGRISPHPQKTDWSISFVTNRRSRKFSELRREERVALVFDGAPRDQFAALSGIAVICDGADERERRCFFRRSSIGRTRCSLTSRSIAWSFGSKA
jgi:general stress protein 26